MSSNAGCADHQFTTEISIKQNSLKLIQEKGSMFAKLHCVQRTFDCYHIRTSRCQFLSSRAIPRALYSIYLIKVRKLQFDNHNYFSYLNHTYYRSEMSHYGSEMTIMGPKPPIRTHNDPFGRKMAHFGRIMVNSDAKTNGGY